ncbi:hypothetical protein OPV22_029775 [Ensete ventricosum]|uniref:Maternal effect embryo arrest 22 n=1 Tax=Ensete ventricosum TaxID=4639 RepID=A0AAV8QC51_ENSVE|nr:hypothetical protein OPV22_029775 [Ensete ventricosum]
MAADVASDSDPLNPCCAKLRQKFLKLEGSRNALRQAVQILEQQVNKLESENANLKKVNQEQENAEFHKRSNEEESSIIHTLEKQINELKSEISAYQQMETKDHSNSLEAHIAERDAEIKMLRESLVKEKMRGDAEKKKAEIAMKKAADAKKLLDMEKSKCDDVRKLANADKKKAEEVRLSLEKFKIEVNEARAELVAERTKVHKLDKLIEEEKQKTIMEKKRAELERTKAEELSKILEVQRREARDEKVHVEHMKQMLEDEKQHKENLQRKLVEIISEREAASGCLCSRDKKLKGDTSAKPAVVKTLKEQLKFAKKQLKYAKRVTKLEKAEKKFISQQFHLLKQEFIRLSCHLKMLGDQISHVTEGTHSLGKIEGSSDPLGYNLQNVTFGLRRSDRDLQLGNCCCKGSLHIPGSSRECSCFAASGRRNTRRITGTKSEVDHLTRDSSRNRPQSSTVCSTSTTCPDRELTGSQAIDATFPATSSKLVEGFSSQGLIIPNVPHADAEHVHNKMTASEAKKTDRSCIRNDFDDTHRSGSVYEGNKFTDRIQVRGGGKKRKIHDPLASITSFCNKDNQAHSIERHFSGKNLMRTKGAPLKEICHQNNGTSKIINASRGLRAEMHGSFISAEDKQEITHLQPSSEVRKDEIDIDCSMLPCFPCKSKINENNPLNITEEIRAVSNDQADLVFSENVTRDDCMKLLMLDDVNDERRYREAIERPLSPTLPVIKCSVVGLIGEDQSHYLVKELFREPTIDKDNFEPHHYFDVINVEINSNKLELVMPTPSVSKDNVGSVHASEESELNSALTFVGDLNKHEELNNFGHNHENNISSGTGKGSDMRDIDVIMKTTDFPPSITKLRENLQAEPLVHHVIDPYVASALNVRSNASTRENDQHLASGLFDDQVNDIMKEHDNHHAKKKSLVIGNNSLVGEKSSQIGCHQTSNPSQIVRSESYVHLSANRELINALGGNVGLEGTTGFCDVFSDTEDGNRISHIIQARNNIASEKTGCCVVFSHTKDEDSISRIFQARNNLASKNFGRSHVDFNILEVLHSLALELDLQSEEKVCVFFSLVLGNITGSLFANSGSIMVENVLQFTKSFATETSKVISDATACQLFSEICQLDILLHLIDDFLITRRIMVCNGMESDQTCSSPLSSKSYQLNGQNVTETAAKTYQLIAASILSGSICAVFDQIGFLLEVSYKVLCLCKHDTNCNLLMLHIFAFAIGENFFTLEKFNFHASAIKSVVSLLESGHHSLLSFRSASDVDICFSPCKHCPFSKDAVCTEKFVSMLMDILQDSFAGCSSVGYSCTSSLYPLSESNPQVKGSICCSREPDSSSGQCDASCVLFKYGDHAVDFLNYNSKRALCYFVDIVSVVELFGCYMNWKWISDNLLSRLLHMLESYPPNEFSAVVVVLVGQLGRFGIDLGGYQQTGVPQLRNKLSTLLDTYAKGRSNLPNQLAIVGALVNLLPISFEEIINGRLEHPVDTIYPHQIKLVKQWFSHLDKKLQILVSNFFGHADL